MRLLWAVVCNATFLTSTALAAEFPGWAYPPCPAAAPSGKLEAAQSLSVAGSGIHFTRAELRDRSSAPDWFPREHEALPPVVAGNHLPKKLACGFCHLPDGNGRPENAKLAGLPPSYIIAQVKAFHALERRAAQPDWAPATLMVNSTADLTEEELAAAADYFSHQQVRSFVHVVESDKVPVHTAACFIFAPASKGRVSLGSAIVEMPIDIERFERRDPHTTYVAYVPREASSAAACWLAPVLTTALSLARSAMARISGAAHNCRGRLWQVASRATCFASYTVFNPAPAGERSRSQCAPS